jgi:phosphatidylserine/phosphatidylglycerophosphate/cardiolipin synthase-like enzyme
LWNPAPVTGLTTWAASPDRYGPRTPWHDIQAEVHGPAVHDLEHTFRERWYGSNVLDLPSPARQLYDRAYHIGAMTSRPLPEPARTTGPSRLRAPTRAERLWATPLYRLVYYPDGRPVRDRLRGRL